MSYADLNGQRGMAFDNVRNEFYEAAIKQVVTPDSVVLDLGSGLGIHALMAARAGARRVFMVEPENVVHCAKEIAKHNGYGDRVEAFQGRIEEVELPEKVDVIISVFTGNLLYSEDLLPSLYYARDKWLKPGGTMIPNAAELMMAPMSAKRLYADAVEVWSKPHREFDYSPLRRYAGNMMLSDRSATAEGELLAEAQSLVKEDFYAASTTHLDRRATFQIDKDGLCHALHTWIRIHVGDECVATGPINAPMHWTAQSLPLDSPLGLSAGQTLETRLRRPAFGEWTWSAVVDGEKRQHSTFLSLPLDAKGLMRISPNARVKLGDRGRAALQAMVRMDGTHASRDIAAELCKEYPRIFAEEKEAQLFVSSLASRFG
jgi:hypothetical protein